MKENHIDLFSQNRNKQPIKDHLIWLQKKYGITDFISNVKKETGGNVGEIEKYKYSVKDDFVTVQKLTPNGETEWKFAFFNMEDAKNYVSVEEQLGIIDESKLKLKEYQSKFKDNPNADWLNGEYRDGNNTHTAGVALDLYPNKEQAIREIKHIIVANILKEKAKDKLADGGKVDAELTKPYNVAEIISKIKNDKAIFIHWSELLSDSDYAVYKEFVFSSNADYFHKIFGKADHVGKYEFIMERYSWIREFDGSLFLITTAGYKHTVIYLVIPQEKYSTAELQSAKASKVNRKKMKDFVQFFMSKYFNGKKEQGGNVDINETLAGGSECVGWMEKFQGMDTSAIDVEAFSMGGVTGVGRNPKYNPSPYWGIYHNGKYQGLMQGVNEEEAIKNWGAEKGKNTSSKSWTAKKDYVMTKWNESKKEEIYTPFAGGGGVYTPTHYSPEEWEMFRKEFNETFSKRYGPINPTDIEEKEYYVSSAFPENKIHKLGKVWWISNYAHAGFGRSEYPTLAKAKDELYTKYRANIGKEKGYESGGAVSVANKKHLDDLYKQAGSVDAAMQLYAGELEIFGLYFGHKVDPNKKRKWSDAYDYLNKTKHGFVIFVTPKGGGFKPHVWIEGGKFDYEQGAEFHAKQLRKMRDLYKKVEIIPVTDERAVEAVAKMEEGGILENLQSGEAEFARGGGIHADRTLSFDKADYEKLIGTGKFYADEIGGEHYIHELPKSKTKIKANALGAWANGKLKLSEKEITPLAAWLVEEKYFDGTINPLYSKGDLVRPIIGGELYEPGEILSRSRERELGHNMYEVKMYDTVKNDGSWQPHWFMEGILLPIPRNASQTVKFKPIIDAMYEKYKFGQPGGAKIV